MKPRIIPTTIEHCRAMAPHMRAADKEEAWSLTAFLPYEALEYSFENSSGCWSVFVDDTDVPAFMFGLSRDTDIINPKRSVWLLGTDKIRLIKKQFVKESGEVLDTLAQGETVYNYVRQGNTASLRWLKLLGFTIMEPKPFGWLQKPFHYVKKDIPSCALSQHQQH